MARKNDIEMYSAHSEGKSVVAETFIRTLRHIDRYLKNGFSKSIVHVIKHANFQLFRVQADGVI